MADVSITQLMLPTLFRPRHRSRINYGADSQRLPKLRASPYIWSHTTTPSRLIFWGSSSEPNSKLLKIPWRIFRNVVGKSIHMGVTRSAAQFMRFTIKKMIFPRQSRSPLYSIVPWSDSHNKIKCFQSQ